MRSEINAKVKSMICDKVISLLYYSSFQGIKKSIDNIIEENANLVGYPLHTMSKVRYKGISYCHSTFYSKLNYERSERLDNCFHERLQIIVDRSELVYLSRAKIIAFISKSFNHCYAYGDIIYLFPEVLHPTINDIFTSSIDMEGYTPSEKVRIYAENNEECISLIHTQYLKSLLLN